MSRKHNETLESIKYSKGSLRLLDQRRLPFETTFDEICTIEDITTAIKEMRVRGAPAIAVSAALGIAVAADRKLREGVWATGDEARAFLLHSCEHVAMARPTAVNLSKTLSQLRGDIAALPAADCPAEMVAAATRLAEAIYAEDVAFNEGIMRKGAGHIAQCAAPGARLRVLTICNTGALATSRYGTALGVVRQLFYDGRLEQVFACETRPWNQGARLTVYECVQEGIPCTLICDSAAAALMRTRQIDAVIVGADRICQNGDTANKIGTYALAVTALHHDVPFYVAAPSTTLDPHTPNGAMVEIEERETTEITHNMQTHQRIVAEGPHLSIWNPVFDITPGELITGGIITERGVFTPMATAPFFDIKKIATA